MTIPKEDPKPENKALLPHEAALLEIREGDAGFSTWLCGTWTKI